MDEIRFQLVLVSIGVLYLIHPGLAAVYASLEFLRYIYGVIKKIWFTD